VRDTVVNTFLLVHRSASVKNIDSRGPSSVKKSNSLPDLVRLSLCTDCSVTFSSVVGRCIVCDSTVGIMNVAQSPCKNCASLTPIEQPNYRNYDILNCDRPLTCVCQRAKNSFISLSSIKSFSCSVAQQIHCDPLIPTNIRTTASGINTGHSPSYTWKVKGAIANSWTCKRCTLLNGPNRDVCEACDAPYTSDFNSNFNPSVIIKVNSLNFFQFSFFFFVLAQNVQNTIVFYLRIKNKRFKMHNYVSRGRPIKTLDMARQPTRVASFGGKFEIAMAFKEIRKDQIVCFLTLKS
jgi:hypothetical protein